MALKIKTQPSVEPISLQEAKLHLRIDSQSLEDNLTTEISIAPGAHIVAASYTLVGGAVEVSGYDAIVNLIAGTNGTSGTVDVKLQESEDNAAWSDVSGGAFTQVTEANDNAVQEKSYTGSYRYIRAVATVGTATCSFGVEVVKKAGPSTEDAELNIAIAAARRFAEWVLSWRAFITQTLEFWLDEFPDKNGIELPMPPLQSVSSIKYYDTSDVEYTIAPTEYFQDTKSEPGWVVLNDGKSWPTTTLRPANGVCLTFIAGYGAAGSDVPADIRQALLLMLNDFYEHRGDILPSTMSVNMKRAKQILGAYKAY
jgi:uncharacterized phiE125 gp8 family phage protein